MLAAPTPRRSHWRVWAPPQQGPGRREARGGQQAARAHGGGCTLCPAHAQAGPSRRGPCSSLAHLLEQSAALGEPSAGRPAGHCRPALPGQRGGGGRRPGDRGCCPRGSRPAGQRERAASCGGSAGAPRRRRSALTPAPRQVCEARQRLCCPFPSLLRQAGPQPGPRANHRPSRCGGRPRAAPSSRARFLPYLTQQQLRGPDRAAGGREGGPGPITAQQPPR